MTDDPYRNPDWKSMHNQKAEELSEAKKTITHIKKEKIAKVFDVLWEIFQAFCFVAFVFYSIYSCNSCIQRAEKDRQEIEKKMLLESEKVSRKFIAAQADALTIKREIEAEQTQLIAFSVSPEAAQTREEASSRFMLICAEYCHDKYSKKAVSINYERNGIHIECMCTVKHKTLPNISEIKKHLISIEN